MKYIYIVIVISLGAQIPCPLGLKVCNQVHIGKDTARYYYCDRDDARHKLIVSRHEERWLEGANGFYPVYYLSRSLDSIPMTKSNIDSLNKLKP